MGIYIWKEANVITETSTIPLYTNGRLLLSKSGYKITNMVFELAISGSTSSAWYPKIYDFTDNAETSCPYDFGVNLRSGSTWGYSESGYTGGNMRYGALYSDSNMNIYLDFPSSASSSSQSAVRLEITENSCNVKVGKTYGTWLYENTFTPGTTLANVITNCFNGSFLKVSHPSTSNTIGRKNIIVTYEEI